MKTHTNRRWLLLALVVLGLVGCDDSSLDPITEDLIIFSLYQGGELDIYRVNADGSDRRNLTADTEWRCGTGRLLPDHDQILFSCWPGNNQELWLMDTNGQNRQQLTTLHPNSYLDHRYTVSPDGSRVLFFTSQGGERLMEISIADGGQHEVIRDNHAYLNARYSPDGTWIAACSDSQQWKTVLIDRASAEVTLLPGQASVPTHPVFSANSLELVYFATAETGVRLLVYDIASGDTTVLKHPSSEGRALFTPNGSNILYNTQGAAGPLIHLDRTTGKESQFSEEDEMISMEKLSRDGTSLLTLSYIEGESCLKLLDLESYTWTTVPGSEYALSPDW